jgi:hypothetical protein
MTTPTTLIVETTDPGEPPDFLGDSADIVYFISFAHAERYGTDHPLSRAAAYLKRKLRVNLAPLMNYADARTEHAEEEALLERLWQEAQPLADSARAAAEAIDATPELREMTSELPELPQRLRELAGIADWAADRGARIRLTYVI